MKVNKYDEYLKLNHECERIRLDIMNLISDYYNFNDQFRINHYGYGLKKVKAISIEKTIEKDFENNGYFYSVMIIIESSSKKKYCDIINQSEFDDIMKFVDNPEVYKNSKKFNI